MKLAILALALILSGVSIPAFAADYTFGVRLIPEKIVVNSGGTLQIHALKNDSFFPKQMDSIIVTSDDSSIIQILETKTDSSIMIVEVKAISEGETYISIAGQGFLPQKFPITVYSSKNNQAQLLMKVTPSNFNINGPTKGYVSVELADADGNPTKAINDIAIKLTLSKNSILNLEDQEIMIKKGEYFVTKEFAVIKPGDVTIYASGDGMGTANSVVTVNQGTAPLKVQLYVYPQTISSYATSYSYAIVQLQDSAGNPIKATQDIPISVKIIDSSLSASVNSSPIYEQIKADGPLEIKKGSYWGYVKLITRHGLEGAYDVSISTQNYEVSSSAQLISVDLELLDDKYSKLDPLPILATGNEELIGVLRLEDTLENPVGAERDLPIQIDSSDNNSLLVKNTLLGKGFGSELVFAKVGLFQPDSLTLKFPSEIDETITPTIIGPTKSSLTLIADPLVTKAIDDTEFPIMVYLSSDYAGTDEITYFLEDAELRTAPNEYFKIENQKVQKGQGGILLNAKSLKDGLATLAFEMGEHSAILDMENIVSKPTSISISTPQPILANLENIFVIQILDSEDQPLYSTKDMEIKLITNDKSILEVPESIILPRGEYFATFSTEAKKKGNTDLMALSEGMPIAEYNLNIDDLSPTITISSPDNVKQNTAADISLLTQYSDTILPNMNVEWHADGAQIISSDQTTDENGIAAATVVSDSTSTFTIEATVTGSGFSESTASKAVGILVENVETPNSQNLKPFTINGFDPLPLLIPAGIASGAIMIKKKSVIGKIKSQE